MIAKNGTSYNLANGINNTRESYLNSSNGSNGNGVHAAQLYAACPSDYDAVAIDVTPQPAPKPAWRDQFPQFTHNLTHGSPIFLGLQDFLTRCIFVAYEIGLKIGSGLLSIPHIGRQQICYQMNDFGSLRM